MSDPLPDETPGADENRPSDHGPFSLEHLRELVELMEKHSLTEVSLKSGETQWKLRRGPEVVTGIAAPPPAIPMPQSQAPAAAAAPAPAAATPQESGVFIKSPTVGTFYVAASPDDPPFVSIGSRVEPETVVCLIEAMKVFNQIPAEVAGVIAEILVQNGDSVEFGQPLFRVRPG